MKENYDLPAQRAGYDSYAHRLEVLKVLRNQGGSSSRNQGSFEESMKRGFNFRKLESFIDFSSIDRREDVSQALKELSRRHYNNYTHDYRYGNPCPNGQVEVKLLKMMYFQDRQVKEISQITGIKDYKVRTKLFWGLYHLEQILAERKYPYFPEGLR